jgi:hypothetical protein
MIAGAAGFGFLLMAHGMFIGRWPGGIVNAGGDRRPGPRGKPVTVYSIPDFSRSPTLPGTTHQAANRGPVGSRSVYRDEEKNRGPDYERIGIEWWARISAAIAGRALEGRVRHAGRRDTIQSHS